VADIAAQTVDRAGLNPTFSNCAGGGDKFVNTGTEFLYLKNGDVASKTLSMVIQSTPDGQTVAAKQVVVPAGEFRIIGPFPPMYNDTQSKVNLTYSAVTSLQVAVMKLTTA